MPKSITSLAGFIKKIEYVHSAAKGDLFYRGHPDVSYQLKPSVFRNKSLSGNEKKIIYRAMSEMPKEFDSDKYFFDKLVRAQHYGIPTRLLDLTINPLIALYFACERSAETRAQVVVLEVPEGDAKFFLSDAVSCKANLAQLTDSEVKLLRKELTRSFSKVLGKSYKRKKLLTWKETEPEKWGDVICDFNEKPTAQRLAQFIREEKPYFRGAMDPIDLAKPEVVIPKKSNSRIAAQSGAFLAYGLNEMLSDVFAARQNIKKIVVDISPDKKSAILAALSSIGIKESFVYPEFERAASEIRSAYGNV